LTELAKRNRTGKKQNCRDQKTSVYH